MPDNASAIQVPALPPDTAVPACGDRPSTPWTPSQVPSAPPSTSRKARLGIGPLSVPAHTRKARRSSAWQLPPSTSSAVAGRMVPRPSNAIGIAALASDGRPASTATTVHTASGHSSKKARLVPASGTNASATSGRMPPAPGRASRPAPIAPSRSRHPWPRPALLPSAASAGKSQKKALSGVRWRVSAKDRELDTLSSPIGSSARILRPARWSSVPLQRSYPGIWSNSTASVGGHCPFVRLGARPAPRRATIGAWLGPDGWPPSRME